MYGPVKLRMLLRLKLSYQPIEGLVVYDETFKIKPWLQENGYLADGFKTEPSK
jgi:hypothetical protein